MNRQQRRAANKAKPAYLRESKEQIQKRLVQNGITAKDLERSYEKGRKDGFMAASKPVFEGVYAGVMLALRELYGFGTKRCTDVIRCVEKHMVESLTSEELIENVWTEMGLKLVFDDPFERIQEVE